MAKKNKAASPGYKTPNEKYNEEFAVETTDTIAGRARAASNKEAGQSQQ